MANQIQFGWVTQFNYTVIRSEKLKPEKVTSILSCFSLVNKMGQWILNWTTVSPDTHRLILYNVAVYQPMSVCENGGFLSGLSGMQYIVYPLTVHKSIVTVSCFIIYQGVC